MILFSLINVMAQSIAALLIFFVGYLTLILCVLAGLAIASLIYASARFCWSLVVAGYAATEAVPARFASGAHMILCQAEIIREQAVPARSTDL